MGLTKRVDVKLTEELSAMYFVGDAVTVIRYAGQLNVPATIIHVYPEERRARVQFEDGSQWTLRTDIDLVEEMQVEAVTEDPTYHLWGDATLYNFAAWQEHLSNADVRNVTEADAPDDTTIGEALDVHQSYQAYRWNHGRTIPAVHLEYVTPQVVTVPDGYNGHTVNVFTSPVLDETENAVKLRVADPGKEYMFKWVWKEALGQ